MLKSWSLRRLGLSLKNAILNMISNIAVFFFSAFLSYEAEVKLLFLFMLFDT
jgi:hypothetical protein